MSNRMTGSGIPFRVRVGATVASRVRTHDASRSESGQSRRSESGQGRRPESLLLRDEWIEYTIPEKPNSRLQKYWLTLAGERALKDRVHLMKMHLEPLLLAGWIERTIPDKPRSSKQKYRLTEKGRRVLGSAGGQDA